MARLFKFLPILVLGMFLFLPKAHADFSQPVINTNVGYVNGITAAMRTNLNNTDLPGSPRGHVNSITLSSVQLLGHCSSNSNADHLDDVILNVLLKDGATIVSSNNFQTISETSSSTPTFTFGTGIGSLNIEDIKYFYVYSSLSSCSWGTEIYGGSANALPTGWLTSTATTYSDGNCAPLGCDAVDVSGAFYGLISFTISGDFVQALSFGQPDFNQTYKSGNSTTFSGTCPYSGTNELALTFDPTNIGDATNDGINPHGDTVGTFATTSPTSAVFNITCTGGAWSAIIRAPLGEAQQVIIMDKQTKTYAANFFTATLTGDAPTTLTFNVPFINGFSAPDFSDWYLKAFNLGLSDSTVNYHTVVGYGTSTSSPFTEFDSSLSYLGIQGSYDITKNATSSPGSYFAEGFLINNNTNATIATTSILSFTITPGARTAQGVNGQSPSDWLAHSGDSTKPLVECNQSNPIVSGICSVLVYVFVPKRDDLTQFSSLWDGIKTKPPFGWFTVAGDTLGGLNAATPTSTPVSLGGLSIIVTPIDYALSFLVGFSFVIFIYHRLRKFNF